MHKRDMRPTNRELFELGEKFGTQKFTTDRRYSLWSLAGAVALNVGTLFDPEEEYSDAARDNIAEALFRALQKSEDVDVSLLKEVVGALLDAYGVDRSEIKKAFVYVVKNGEGKTDRGAIAMVLQWVGADFFRSPPP